MGRDRYEAQEPTYYRGNIQWGIRTGDPNIVFQVDSSPFISRFPVENDRVFDREHISDVAHEHWDVLEEIATAAVDRDEIEKIVKRRYMNEQVWRIRSRAFSRLAEERGYRP